jgi:hypothetical protein
VSDGITANIEDSWVLEDLDCVDRTQVKTHRTGRKITARDADGAEIKDDNGKPLKIDEEILLLQRSANWTLVRRRKLVGVTKIKPQNGQFKSVFALLTGPATDISFTSIGRIKDGKKFLCVGDNLKPVNIRTGECQQRQVWVYMSPWENMQPELSGGYDVAEEEKEEGGGDSGGES